MRKYLLPEKGNFYKANLHSHSNMSDGKQTPEQMKRLYKENGYSILAISDHDFLHAHNDLTEEDFLLLTAYEISIRDYDSKTPHAWRKVMDLNLFAKRPEQDVFIGFHPETVEWLVERGKITQEDVDRVTYAGGLRELHYSPAIINDIIRCANDNGYLVSLNHPSWSLINYSDYSRYEGAWAVEVYNNACAWQGLPDSEHVFEEMLRQGKRIFATATDDNHSEATALGGFTMIKSERLDYASIIHAMERGEFYASNGPEITELYYEDGRVHIACSPAKKISLLTIGRKGKAQFAGEGELLTSADFEIDLELYGYLRLRVTDADGNHAWTNAYYVDELIENATALRALPPDEH